MRFGLSQGVQGRLQGIGEEQPLMAWRICSSSCGLCSLNKYSLNFRPTVVRTSFERLQGSFVFFILRKLHLVSVPSTSRVCPAGHCSSLGSIGCWGWLEADSRVGVEVSGWPPCWSTTRTVDLGREVVELVSRPLGCWTLSCSILIFVYCLREKMLMTSNLWLKSTFALLTKLLGRIIPKPSSFASLSFNLEPVRLVH